MSTYEQQDYSGSNFGRCPSWCHQRLIRMPTYSQRIKALRVRQQYKIHWSQNVKFPALVYLLITRIFYNRQVLKKQAVGGRPPRYAPAQACKWWHDVRHVRIWIGSSLLYVHVGLPVHEYNQPKWPGDLDLLTLKVVSESRVTWATSVPILVFLGLSVLELCPLYAPDRQMSDKSIA